MADFGNYRIQVFTEEGHFVRMFGGQEKSFQPVGVAVDANGLVYVSEVETHCVSVFTSEGVFVKSFGKEGNRLGEFKCPQGLAVDCSGVVYVCDCLNKRVQIF